MKSQPSRTLPRLVVEKSHVSPYAEVGFLEVHGSSERVEIGGTDTREFKLVQCLFSPHNFVSAKYQPVAQTHERVFDSIGTGSPAAPSERVTSLSTEMERAAVVERSIKSLRAGAVGNHFIFVSDGARVQMSLIA